MYVVSVISRRLMKHFSAIATMKSGLHFWVKNKRVYTSTGFNPQLVYYLLVYVYFSLYAFLRNTYLLSAAMGDRGLTFRSWNLFFLPIFVWLRSCHYREPLSNCYPEKRCKLYEKLINWHDFALKDNLLLVLCISEVKWRTVERNLTGILILDVPWLHRLIWINYRDLMELASCVKI